MKALVKATLIKHYMRFAVKLASQVATDNPPHLIQGLFCQASLRVTSLASLSVASLTTRK